ncbi:MAG: pyruvate kinase [Coprococcus sp.]
MQYYGTLGPACANEKILTAMFKEGMTGMRLNTSHGRLADMAGWIEIAGRAAMQAGRDWELLIDLKGPELRIGHVNAPMELEKGRRVIMTVPGYVNGGGSTGEKEWMWEKCIPIPVQVLNAVDSGRVLWLDDSRLKLKVVTVDRENGWLEAEILHGGLLQSDKSMAVDGLEIDMPALTPMDIENIRYGAANDIGLMAVMQPFVRNSQDLMDVRKVLDDNGCSHVRIMAKIENLSGVRALPELLPYCDMVVIARGDLGTAVSLSQLPVVQKKIESICHQASKPYMVVTQMLDSMMRSPVPTRAEVSDIAHAVFCGADALMLTGETAAGKYPVEAMHYLIETAENAEKYMCQ